MQPGASDYGSPGLWEVRAPNFEFGREAGGVAVAVIIDEIRALASRLAGGRNHAIGNRFLPVVEDRRRLRIGRTACQ